MLRLASATPPTWAAAAIAHMDEVLLDHAHCEKKAASTAINLIFRYPEYPQLVTPLSALAREELEHFERVVELMRSRSLEFKRQRPSPYAGRLLEIVRKEEPQRMVDLLICCAFIEARSCERMKLLSETLDVGDLQTLYADLLASEARHHTTYIDLARQTGVIDELALDHRVREIANHEAAVIADASELPRLHT